MRYFYHGGILASMNHKPSEGTASITFEFIINLKAVKQIELAIRPKALALANEVIK